MTETIWSIQMLSSKQYSTIQCNMIPSETICNNNPNKLQRLDGIFGMIRKKEDSFLQFGISASHNSFTGEYDLGF